MDAAWAGVTLACPEFRAKAQLKNINKYTDSFCTNFHKVRVFEQHYLDLISRSDRLCSGDWSTLIVLHSGSRIEST